MTKARRELLERVARGKWFDGPDSDIGRLEAMFSDGLVYWRDPGYNAFDPPEGYFLTERGRELLEVGEQP